MGGVLLTIGWDLPHVSDKPEGGTLLTITSSAQRRAEGGTSLTIRAKRPGWDFAHDSCERPRGTCSQASGRTVEDEARIERDRLGVRRRSSSSPGKARGNGGSLGTKAQIGKGWDFAHDHQLDAPRAEGWDFAHDWRERPGWDFAHEPQP